MFVEDRFIVGPHELFVVPDRRRPYPTGRGRDDAARAVAAVLEMAANGVEPSQLAASPNADIAAAIRARRLGGNVIGSVSPAGNEEDVALVHHYEMAEPISIAWGVLESALDELLELRGRWTPKSTLDLFSDHPTGDITTGDLERVWVLEAELKAIDDARVRALEAELKAIGDRRRALLAEGLQKIGDEPPALIDRRRALLAECADAQIFSDVLGQERTTRLRVWNAERLLQLRVASETISTWGLSGHVCLDYARLGLWPNADEAYEWAQRGVRLLEDEDDPGSQGLVTAHTVGGTVRVFWRRDEDRPAVLAIYLDR